MDRHTDTYTDNGDYSVVPPADPREQPVTRGNGNGTGPLRLHLAPEPPPQTPESIAKAKDAQRTERQMLLDALRDSPDIVQRLQASFLSEPDYPEQLRASLHGMADVNRLIDIHGIQDVLLMVKVAARHRGVKL